MLATGKKMNKKNCMEKGNNNNVINIIQITNTLQLQLNKIQLKTNYT